MAAAGNPTDIRKSQREAWPLLMAPKLFLLKGDLFPRTIHFPGAHLRRQRCEFVKGEGAFARELLDTSLPLVMIRLSRPAALEWRFSTFLIFILNQEDNNIPKLFKRGLDFIFIIDIVAI